MTEAQVEVLFGSGRISLAEDKQHLSMIRFVSMTAFLILAPYWVAGALVPDDTVGLDISQNDAINVYLDCRRCDRDYIHTEITFVNYVRDRRDAHVHILITTQRTASRGMEYTITYVGQKKFIHQNDTLRYIANEFDADSIIREGLVRTLKLGLIRYVAQTPLGDQIIISYQQGANHRDIVDKWDSWVFRISINNSLDGEAQKNEIDLNGSISADRITPELIIRSRMRGSYNEENYYFADNTVSSSQQNTSFNCLVAKSLSRHWSLGARGRVSSSSYRNIRKEYSLAPAIEFNAFPYSESTRRELRFQYAVSYNPVNYLDTTLFNVTSEKLMRQSMDITLALKETWGSIRVSLDGSHYFHNPDFYRVELYSHLDLNLYKGLSLNLSGEVSKINDQLSLLKRDFSTEEILLGTSQLATDFEYGISMGLSFSFGSIYSNVVNPRFGN